MPRARLVGLVVTLVGLRMATSSSETCRRALGVLFVFAGAHLLYHGGVRPRTTE